MSPSSRRAWIEIIALESHTADCKGRPPRGKYELKICQSHANFCMRLINFLKNVTLFLTTNNETLSIYHKRADNFLQSDEFGDKKQ